MSTVTIRQLSKHAGRVLREVAESGRPAIVTNNGLPVAAVIGLDQGAVEALEDYILMTAPEYLAEMEQADVSQSKDARTVHGEQSASFQSQEWDAPAEAWELISAESPATEWVVTVDNQWFADEPETDLPDRLSQFLTWLTRLALAQSRGSTTQLEYLQEAAGVAETLSRVASPAGSAGP